MVLDDQNTGNARRGWHSHIGVVAESPSQLGTLTHTSPNLCAPVRTHCTEFS